MARIMSSDLNRLILFGRMVRAIEIKSTQNGGLVGKFTLTSNRKEKRGDSWQEAVGFFDVVCFGKQAETLKKYTDKGSRIAIEGHLRFYQWEGSDGKKHSKIEIGLDGFQFLDSKQEGQRERGPLERTGEPFGQRPSAAFNSGAMSADDIPF